MPLTSDDRRRAAIDLQHFVRDREQDPPAVAPITDDRWERFVSRVTSFPDEIAEVEVVVTAAPATGEFVHLRNAARLASSRLRSADSSLRPATMFEHAHRPEVVRVRKLLVELAHAWLTTLTRDDAARGSGDIDAPASSAVIEQIRRSWGSIASGVLSAGADDRDPWLAAFGVKGASVRDATGRFSVPLLVAQYHGRLDELERRLQHIYTPFGGSSLSPLKAVRYTHLILDTPDPIESVGAAMNVRKLIGEKFAKAPGHTASVLRSLLEDVERSYANITMINDLQWRIADTTREGKRAMLRLDLYRRMAEGQLRPWAWTLTCLHKEVAGATPMLSELVDRLGTVEDDTAQSLAKCIEVQARNAAAHEDYFWDARQRRLVSGQQTLDPDELEDLAVRGHGLMAGCELGWALACGDDPDLSAALHPARGEDVPVILVMDEALVRFATNTLQVRDWDLDGDRLRIDLKELTPHGINPCAQAVLEISMFLPEVEHFEVGLVGSEQIVMKASRAALVTMLPGWLAAVSRYAKMPPALFLPTLFESRRLVESPAVALEAIDYFSLNEAVHFLNDLPESPMQLPSRETLARVSASLTLINMALEACGRAEPELADQLCGRTFRAIQGAATYAGKSATAASHRDMTETLNLLDRMDSKIRQLWGAHSPYAVLPTLDPTPLSPPRE